MELTVHAPSRLDGQDRHLLVQSAAHRLVVHLRLLRDSVLKCRAGARVGAVPHRYVVVIKPDDVPEGDVAVHSLGSVPACGHVGEDDVREPVAADAARPRGGADTAVRELGAASLAGRAHGVYDAGVVRGFLDGFEDEVV